MARLSVTALVTCDDDSEISVDWCGGHRSELETISLRIETGLIVLLSPKQALELCNKIDEFMEKNAPIKAITKLAEETVTKWSADDAADQKLTALKEEGEL